MRYDDGGTAKDSVRFRFFLPGMESFAASATSQGRDNHQGSAHAAYARALPRELVSKTRMTGRREVVGRYFGNYASVHDWQLAVGFVDRHPALIVGDPRDAAGASAYFILLQWADEHVSAIRDFRHARYAIEGAEVLIVQ
jgi:hypothetical protein